MDVMKVLLIVGVLVLAVIVVAIVVFVAGAVLSPWAYAKSSQAYMAEEPEGNIRL